MNYLIARLCDIHKPSIISHFLSLSDENRRNRFNVVVNESFVVNYVNAIDCENEWVLGAYIDEKLCGVMHIAPSFELHNVWEIGISVLEPFQKKGIAKALVQRDKKISIKNKWKQLEMLHVKHNYIVSNLCKREGFVLVVNDIELVGTWHAPNDAIDTCRLPQFLERELFVHV